MKRRIKHLRTTQGISQRGLAQELGISYSAVQKLEGDEGDPKWSTISAMADYFKVSSDFLMGRDFKVIAAHSDTAETDEKTVAEALAFMRRMKKIYEEDAGNSEK